MATPLPSPIEEAPAPAGDAADEAGRREAFAVVKSAVAGLPPRQRDAVDATYRAGIAPAPEPIYTWEAATRQRSPR